MVLCSQGNDELAGGDKHAFYRYYAYLLKLGKWQKFVNEFPAYLQDKSLGGYNRENLKNWRFIFI